MTAPPERCGTRNSGEAEPAGPRSITYPLSRATSARISPRPVHPGSRLRPITHTAAKQLVPVANKPVLFYGIESIVAAGITGIGVVVGGTAEQIRAALGDGSAFGARITYLPQEAPLGPAHAVLIAQDRLGDEDFVMYLGDDFVVVGIADVVEEFRRERPDFCL
jgi:glucose-1-phosphate thymidylyltransferase